MDRIEVQAKTVERLNMLGAVYYGLIDAGALHQETEAECDNDWDHPRGIVSIPMHDGERLVTHNLCPDCGCEAVESAARGMDAADTPLSVEVYR